MRVPKPRLKSRWTVIALVALAALGAGTFVLLAGDSGDSGAPAEAERERGGKRVVSDDRVVRKLSTEEQIAQVLMLGFEGSAPDQPGVDDVTDENPGAILVRSENWEGADAGKKLIASLSGGSGVPPLVVASQEGGEYRALTDLPPGQTELEIGRDGSAKKTRTWAQEAATALDGAGFHLNLFPVADVATLDSPLAGRAFSDDSAEVASLTEAALEGCDKGGLACAPLHFPGLGAASQDTADGPATIVADIGTLTSRDLVPFGGKASKAPAMVLSLGLYPDFDAVVPGALTPAIATQLLRGDVGFKGVAISDDLGAGAIKATSSVPDAAVAAIGAGVDLVQIASPDDADGVAKAIRQALADGELDPKRLAQAAERVVDLKRELKLVE